MGAKVLWQEKLAASQDFVEIVLAFTVTTTGVLAPITTLSYPGIFGTVATPFTVAAVNALLKFDSTGTALSTTSTAELTPTTCLDATSMGTDAMGFVLDCGGQIKTALWMEASLNGTASSVPLGESVIAVTTEPTSSLSNALYKTPAGNLMGRVIMTGLDAATAGELFIRIYVLVK